MAFDKRKGVKLAGVVLSGSLVLSAPLSVAAQGAETVPETAAHQKEEKTETVVFLNTAPSSDAEKQGPYDGQAVHSMDEVLNLLGEKEEGPAKFEMLSEETRILVLCGETVLSAEEQKIMDELGVLVMTDTEYEAAEKAKAEAEKAKAEAEKKEAEAEKKEADNKADQNTAAGAELQEPVIPPAAAGTEEPPAFLWEAPQVILSGSDKSPAKDTRETVEEEAELNSDETTVDAAEKEAEDKGSIGTSGILLPGFSAPTGVVDEAASEEENSETADKNEAADKTEVTDKEAAEETEITDKKAAADKTEATEDIADSAEDSEATDEEEVEDVVEEEVVYTLFALFNEAEPFNEVADTEAEDLNPMVVDAELESEETSVEVPSVLALPGTDLVGGGTSGVGGGSKPSTPSKPSQPAQTPSSSGSSSAGSSSSGNTATGNTSAGTQTPAPAPQNTTSSGKPVIQTGDASNRTLWGLSAGISGAMAAYFAVQWRKLKNALSK